MIIQDKFEEVLDFFGKKLKLDMKYFFKSTFFASASSMFLGVFSLFTTWVLTSTLTKNEFGLFQFVISLLSLTAIISLPGLNTSLILSVSKGFDKTYNFLINRRFAFSFLGSFVLLVGAISLYYINNNYWKYLLILAILSPSINGFSLNIAYFNGKERFDKILEINVIKKIFVWTPTLLILFFTKNILYIIISYLFMTGLIEIFLHFLINKKIKKSKNHLIDKKAFKYGFQLSFLQGVSIVSNHIDKIILSFYFGLAELANYALIILFKNQLKTLNAIIKVIILPKMSKNDPKLVYDTIKSNLLFITIISILVSLISVLVVPIIIKYFFQDFLSIIPYVQILLLSQCFGYTSSTIVNYLNAMKKIKILTLITIIFTNLRIIMFLIFIPLFGLKGAILTLVLSEIFGVIYTLTIFFKFKEKIIEILNENDNKVVV